MIYIKYVTKNSVPTAWKQIEQGQTVALEINGWRKKIVYELITLYADYSRGITSKNLFFKIGWRSLFAPSLIGLCNHARSNGMTINLAEKNDSLLLKFERK